VDVLGLWVELVCGVVLVCVFVSVVVCCVGVV
jgi:hypothetical protein